MVNIDLAKEILETYPEITIDQDRSKNDAIVFSLLGKTFALICSDENDSVSGVIICVLNDDFDYPHILLREIEVKENKNLPQGKYRYVCLHQSESIVTFLQSYEEKIVDSIDRLIELMQFSPQEIEREFQKEFIYYWNTVAKHDSAELFLKTENEYTRLAVYQGEKARRYLSSDIILSDIDNRKNKNKDRVWQRRSDIEAFFIPIIDNRGILPPTKNRRWNAADIVEILYGKRIRHISPATFDAIKNEATHYNCVDLVFSMVINNLPVPFLARLTMKNCAGSNTLLSRIVGGDFSVQEMSIQRQDYGYLNRIIGNQISGNGKKALLVGAGSLGGYVASELVKNGFNNITIYDGDYLEPDNFMRWPFGGIISRMNKAEALKFYLEHMHPEIKVNAQNEYFDADAVSPQISDFDYIIFTVGSSDVQLKLNRVIKEKGITCCVLYAWLEAGGDYSHVLSVKYNNSGCFECLFTDEHGELINNKANMAKEEDVDKNIIFNGCGGTRAAYGTAALLRTVSALLVLMKKIDSTEISKNCLVNITPDSVTYDSTFFIEKRCRCCGNNAQ